MLLNVPNDKRLFLDTENVIRTFYKNIVGNNYAVAAIGGIIFLTILVFTYFGQNNYGVEFFVGSEPEQQLFTFVRAIYLFKKKRYCKGSRKNRLSSSGVDSVLKFAIRWVKPKYSGGIISEGYHWSDTIGNYSLGQ